MIIKTLKWLGYVAFALAVLLAIGALVYRDTPATEVEAKWAKPPSQFVTLEGVRIHYRDEGSGPAIVLLHANYASSFMWEPWAEALRDRYRVIRVDMTAHGLTGPDPTGDYSNDRTVKLFGALVDHLGLETFTVGGTSLGGTIGMLYTIANPGRVERLILISPGSLEKDVRGRTAPREIPGVADIFAYITPRFFVSGLLTAGYGDDAKLTDAVVDEWYEMWMREGNRHAMLDRLRQYVSGDVESKIAQVKVPVLLLWGEKNTRVPVELAYEFQSLLTGAPDVQLEILPGVGHMAVQEAPRETASLAARWLDAARTAAPPPAAASDAAPDAALRSAAAASP